jgi:hypothetical protein
MRTPTADLLDAVREKPSQSDGRLSSNTDDKSDGADRPEVSGRASDKARKLNRQTSKLKGNRKKLDFSLPEGKEITEESDEAVKVPGSPLPPMTPKTGIQPTPPEASRRQATGSSGTGGFRLPAQTNPSRSGRLQVPGVNVKSLADELEEPTSTFDLVASMSLAVSDAISQLAGEAEGSSEEPERTSRTSIDVTMERQTRRDRNNTKTKTASKMMNADEGRAFLKLQDEDDDSQDDPDGTYEV